ncbi:MAG: transglycosylase domain-containing protein [Nocardiopsaceae bacterium]|nr:transglycosylase domain-containing protein [Nocardiopsaceae bacterium]
MTDQADAGTPEEGAPEPAEEQETTAFPVVSADDAPADTDDGDEGDADEDTGSESAPVGDEASAETEGAAEAAATSAFNDSGSFFRERVARTLAEQGFDFREDGTWGEQEPVEPRSKAEEPGSASAEEPQIRGWFEAGASSAADSSAAIGRSADEDSADSSQQSTPPLAAEADTSADDEPATADADAQAVSEEHADSLAEPESKAWHAPVSEPAPEPEQEAEQPAGGADPHVHDEAGDDVWDPEGTAAFTPVFDDDFDDDPGAEPEAETRSDMGAPPTESMPAAAEPVSEPSTESEHSAAAPPTAAEPGTAETALLNSSPADGPKAFGNAGQGGAMDPGSLAGPGGMAASAAESGGAAAKGTPPGGGSPDGGGGSSGGGGDEPPSSAAQSGGDGGGSGKRPKGAKPKKPLWWRITRGGLIGMGVCMLLAIVGFGVAYATIPVPDTAKQEAQDQGSTFYYADGETKFAERGVDRDPVKYEEIPEEVQEAVISAEDRGFWEEPGVSITGTARGVWSTITGQQVQGGSTITQQFVRNYFEGVSKEQTVSRKLQEIIISLKVDRSPNMDKEWVMEQYLNTIYFGRNAYGIQAAAQAYYHKDVGELNASEAAFLAAAIQQPTKFGEADSKTTPEMEKRWQYVVDGMVEEGTISAADAEGLEFAVPEKARPADSTDISGYKGYMLQQAMKEMESLGYTEDNINRGGYKVVTTFDKDVMDMAKDAVESTVDVDSLPEGVQAGLTTIEPETGEVVGFYGGKDYIENQFDSAFSGSAQAGSAFKPYVLATALEDGYSLDSIVDGSSPIFVSGSEIGNAGGADYGPMNLVQATQKSINTGYVQLAQEVGVENVRDTAYSVGIPENKITDNQVVPTIALGVSDVSPVDQASGFATFANKGQYIEAHVIREIVKDGENERPEPEKNQAVSEETAANVTYALQQVVNGGTGSTAALPDGRPVAGKTGTTDSSVATWFVGYTPQLSTAVGVYNGNNQPFSVPGWGSLSGGTLSATIWRNFMAQAMEGKEHEQFPGRTYGGNVQNWAPEPPPEPEEETRPEEEVSEEPEEPEVPPEPETPPEPEIPETPEIPDDPGIPENPEEPFFPDE